MTIKTTRMLFAERMALLGYVAVGATLMTIAYHLHGPGTMLACLPIAVAAGAQIGARGALLSVSVAPLVTALSWLGGTVAGIGPLTVAETALVAILLAIAGLTAAIGRAWHEVPPTVEASPRLLRAAGLI